MKIQVKDDKRGGPRMAIRKDDKRLAKKLKDPIRVTITLEREQLEWLKSQGKISQIIRKLIKENNMSFRKQIATERIEDSENLFQYTDFIERVAEGPKMDDVESFYDWLMCADEKEIVDWAEDATRTR